MRKAVSSADAPGAIGPYSQAIAAGGFLFISGQIPLDAATGKLVGGDIQAQTHKVFENLGAILTAAGASFDDVVKTTVYLCDLSLFPRVNAVYAEAFDSPPFPARATVQVAALPLGALIEIDAIARAKRGR